MKMKGKNGKEDDRNGEESTSYHQLNLPSMFEREWVWQCPWAQNQLME